MPKHILKDENNPSNFQICIAVSELRIILIMGGWGSQLHGEKKFQLEFHQGPTNTLPASIDDDQNLPLKSYRDLSSSPGL